MFGLFRFAVTACIVFVLVAGVAVGWPKVSVEQRPEALETVARLIRGTQLERGLENVLGASTDTARTGLEETSQRLIGGFGELVTERIGVAVGSWSVAHILPVYESFPEEKKELLQSVICGVQEASESAE
jgi:hypothetical protein